MKLKSVNVSRYRISVTKSLNNLFAQIIDDKQKKTLVSASSIEKSVANSVYLSRCKCQTSDNLWNMIKMDQSSCKDIEKNQVIVADHYYKS